MPAAVLVLSSIGSSSETDFSFGQPHTIVGGEGHDLADLLVELHGHAFGTSSKRAAFDVVCEMHELHDLVAVIGEPAHDDQQIARLEWRAIAVQRLDHNGSLAALL